MNDVVTATTTNADLTIVIPAKNEIAMLPKLLESLCRQDYEHRQIATAKQEPGIKHRERPQNSIAAKKLTAGDTAESENPDLPPTGRMSSRMQVVAGLPPQAA